MNKIIIKGKNDYQLEVNKNIIINDFKVDLGVTRDWFFIYIPKGVTEQLIMEFTKEAQTGKYYFIIDDNSKLDLLLLASEQVASGYEFKFIIKTKSEMIINKFYARGEHQEQVTIDLVGVKSKVVYNFSTVAVAVQKYQLQVNHYQVETISMVNNRGITLKDAHLEFEVNGYIPKGMKNSKMEQTSKIITLGSNESKIKPNLMIMENEVIVRHGASMGCFPKDTLFYLQTRGIPLLTCYQLLVTSFLLSILMITDKELVLIKNIIKEVGACYVKTK